MWLRRLYWNKFGNRYVPPVHTICIGNLTAGGTGKTPMIKWMLGKSHVPVAVLSRGYGRKTRGFREVLPNSLSSETGDEPLEIRKTAHPDHRIFVCENRKVGIARIMQEFPACRMILMDDGFQHLRVKAGRYIVLSDSGRPFFSDFPFPAGRLREFRHAIQAADAVVFTKCNPEALNNTASNFRKKASVYTKAPVYFTGMDYAQALPVQGSAYPLAGARVILVTGIASPAYLVEALGPQYTLCRHFNYADHQAFSAADFVEWQKALHELNAAAIITTRKDWMRMQYQLPESLNVWVVDVLPSWSETESDEFLRLNFPAYAF
jgi:tetraacyldisaccharide 4'-kinase